MRYSTQLQGRNIRLLHLELDTYKAPIRCHLVEASLDDLPQYEALSYVWGDPDNTEPILCNGQTLQVTKNLARALRRIRLGISPPKPDTEAAASDIENHGVKSSDEKATSPDTHPSPNSIGTTLPRRYRPSLLWVDAVCIDQNNISERNSQVQLMGEVYSKANRVIVWLGDKKHKSKRMSVIAAAIQCVLAQMSEAYADVIDGDLSRLPLTLIEPFMGANLWQAISPALSSDWFKRVWCCQEFALARSSILLYRNLELNSEHATLFFHWLTFQVPEQRLYPKFPDDVEFTEMLGDSMLILGLNQYKEAPADILWHAARTQAKDPKDKFYGVLGLVGANIVQVDYNKSVAEVYIDSVLQTAVPGLRVLSCVGPLRDLGQQSDLPSWVPDWNTTDGSVLAIELFRKSKGSQEASRQQISKIDPILACSGILRLHGLVCDSVVMVTEDLSPPLQLSDGTSEAKQTWLQDVFSEIWQEFMVNGALTSITWLSWAKTFIGGCFVKPWVKFTTFAEAEEILVSDFKAFVRSKLSEDVEALNDESFLRGNAATYENTAWIILDNRRAFRTGKRWLGLGPLCMRPGDVVVVFHGGVSPYVLRPIEDKPDHYQLVGECYVDNLTNEGAYHMKEEGGVEERVFNLV